MLPSFLQKPSGTLAILVTAIAGPYAAFETDFGASARRVFSNLIGDSFQDSTPSGDGSSFVASSYGPNSAGVGFDSPSLGYQTSIGYPTTSAHPSSVGQAGPHTIYGGAGGMSAMQSPSPNGSVPPGHFVSAQVDSQGFQQQYGLPAQGTPAAPIVESHRGIATSVSGGTHQLWNYTLGVPTVNQLQSQPQALGGGEIHDLREVLRFDIAPGWLPQRFSRVTTVLSNVQLDGLRVPLITGTRPTDLAGTLTYYFDSSQALQRLNLHGLTGDPSQLANLMVQFYGLQPEQSLGGQLFTRRWNNRIISVLHVAPAPIMYAGADHSKYIVFLELNQASANFALSEEASGMLQGAQAIQRW